MKRVKAACICQTLHFMLKENTPRSWAAKQVEQEVKFYKEGLERNHTKFRIVEESPQPDARSFLRSSNNTIPLPLGIT